MMSPLQSQELHQYFVPLCKKMDYSMGLGGQRPRNQSCWEAPLGHTIYLK